MTEQNARTPDEVLADWLKSCTRSKKVARNTVAVGLVVLDHLRKKCPLEQVDVLSKGGEITGARSGLGRILESYGITADYLKEVTTRQSHQDGQRLFESLGWGHALSHYADDERDALLLGLIGTLKGLALDWLRRANLKLEIDRRQSPATWLSIILGSAKGRSGGIVEQHLVGAKLERRFTGVEISNHPSHAADAQTDRVGDFSIERVIYHVTGSPSRNVLQKCRKNVISGLRPILLVPREKENVARVLAGEEKIDKELTIVTIEDFVAINIIEMATSEKKEFFTLLEEIVGIYNTRLKEVESDLSLAIEVK